MPTYINFNKRTKEKISIFQSMAAQEQFLQENPGWEQEICAPAIVGGVASGRSKPDEGFRELLREHKKQHKKGQINSFD